MRRARSDWENLCWLGHSHPLVQSPLDIYTPMYLASHWKPLKTENPPWNTKKYDNNCLEYSERTEMIDSPSRPDPENLCTHLLAPGQAGLQPSIGQSPGSQKSLVGALPLCARLLHPILFSQTEVGHTRSFFSFTRFQFGYGTPFELWIAIVKENLCLFCTHKIKFGVFSSCSKIEHSRGVWMISIKVSRTSSWILITTQFHEIPHDETERETKFWIRGLCSVRTLVLRGRVKSQRWRRWEARFLPYS